jgi:putative ABC transport system permease protein
MFKSYVVSALRNISKNKLASLITVIGFSIGIACALFIFLFVQYELSFDKFLPGHERVYRAILKAQTLQGQDYQTAATNMKIRNPLLSDASGIENITQFVNLDGQLGHENTYFYEKDNFILSIDSSFLKVFGYALAIGDGTALDKPMSMVITPSMAEKYFGAANPLGKIISYQNRGLSDKKYYFTVTGVLVALPRNSRLTFDFVVNMPFEEVKGGVIEYYNRLYGAGIDREQVSLQVQSYVKLKDNAFLPQFQKSLLKTASSIAAADISTSFKNVRLVPEPLDGIYLFSGISSPYERKGNFLFVLLLAGLAIIVIVIACINVINLTTARALTRMKEIGIRKTLGATRKELMIQHLVESVLLSFISLWIAAVLVEVLLPLFNAVIDRDLSIDYLGNPLYPAAVIGIAFFIGILSGFYPAFYLSSLNVNTILRDRRAPSSRRFREIMVVIQFVFSIGLFVTAAIILREFQYMTNKDLGFDPRDTIMVRVNVPEIEKKFPDMKKAIRAVPGVLGVSGTSFAAWKYGDLAQNFPLLAAGSRKYVDIMVVDADYLTVSGIALVQGGNFNPDNPNPFLEDYVVNETAQKLFGFKINSTIAIGSLMGKVIGIAGDFDYQFPSRRIRPLIMITRSPLLVNTAYTPYPIFLTYMLIRMQPGGQQKTVPEVERIWKKFNPGYSFEYDFEDAEIQRQLNEYNRSFESVLGISTVLAFLLSGLGLFGLATFEIERRTKEVGIRKALGATTAQIAVHFILGFLKLIGLANIIAWPATFMLIRAIFSLIQYPHPLLIGPLIFIQSGLISAAVMAVTVGSQVVRAASSNPVNTLRYE